MPEYTTKSNLEICGVVPLLLELDKRDNLRIHNLQRKNKYMRIIPIILIFTLVISVSRSFGSNISLSELVAKYGKDAIIEFILDSRGGAISILFNGKIKDMYGFPDNDLVTPKTIERDLWLLGFDPEYVNQKIHQEEASNKSKVKEKNRLTDTNKAEPRKASTKNKGYGNSVNDIRERPSHSSETSLPSNSGWVIVSNINNAGSNPYDIYYNTSSIVMVGNNELVVDVKHVINDPNIDLISTISKTRINCSDYSSYVGMMQFINKTGKSYEKLIENDYKNSKGTGGYLLSQAICKYASTVSKGIVPKD